MSSETIANLFSTLSASVVPPDNFFAALLDQSDAGIFVCTPGGTLLMLNAVWEETLGLPRHEIIGKTVQEVKSLKTAAPLYRRIRAAHETGERQTFEIALPAESGRRWFKISLFPVRSAGGEIAVIGGIATEITEAREAQETLSDALRRAWNLAQVSPAITYIFDLDRRSLVYINRNTPAAAQTLSSDPSTPADDFGPQFMHPDDVGRFDVFLAQIRKAADGEYRTLEYRMVNRAGETRWYLSRDRVYQRDANGAAQQIIGSAVDITERRQAEAASADLVTRANRTLAELRSTLDILPAGVYIGHTHGIFSVNERGLELLGFDSMDAMNAAAASLADHIQARDPATGNRLSAADNPFIRALQGETSRREVLYRHAKTGEDIIVQCAAAPIYADGEVVAAVAVNTEITESLRLRDDVRRSSAMLNAIISGTSDVVYMKDRSGHFILVNQATAELLGTDAPSILGKRDADFLNAEDTAAIERTDAEIMEKGVTLIREETVTRPDGTHIFLSTKDPLRDAGGAIIGLVGISQDITERKRLDAELQDSRARLQIALDAGKLGAWVAHLGADTMEVSDLWRQIFDFDPEEPINAAARASRMEPEDLENIRALGIKAMAEHADYEAEYRTRRRDGSIRWIAARGRPFYGENGEPSHMIGTAQDITERKVREAELEALNIRLKRSMQETHHRIKNNLQVITALVDMQEAESDGTVPVEAMRRIGTHTRTLATLHDLLTMQAARNAENDALSTRAILSNLVPLLRTSSGGRQVQYEADDALLSQRQSASFALLVSELVSNAVKHAQGRIEISLAAAPAPQTDPLSGPLTHLRLEVCDDGAGFPPGFDPATAANTGLELIDSVARWDLRGTIEFTNRETGGARVSVLFPQEEL